MPEKYAPPVDEAKGVFDTQRFITSDGRRYVDRKPLTAEDIQKLAEANKPKPAPKRGPMVSPSIIERLTIATKDVFLELADAGVPHNAALAIAARLADLTASVVRLDAEVKELKANKGKTVKG